jgi:hypothetical protein
MWSKAIDNCGRARGFLSTVFGGLFKGTGRMGHVSLHNMFGYQPKAVMIWLPEVSGKNGINRFCALLAEILPDWQIAPLHGDVATNREAERLVNNAISHGERSGKVGTVVVSMKIGARSFSVPRIDTIILAFDNGSAAKISQCAARGLTRDPSNSSKVAHVVSLSLDPTRADKLDPLLLETAQRYADKHNVSINDALRVVLNTFDIFTFDENGQITKLVADAYTEKILSIDSLNKIVANVCDLEQIINDPETVEQILAMTVDGDQIGTPEHVATVGKRYAKSLKKNKGHATADPAEREAVALLSKIQHAIEALVHELRFVVSGSGHSTITSALEHWIANNKNVFVEEFNVEPEFVLSLVVRKILPVELLDIKAAVQIKNQTEYKKGWW